MSAEVLKCELGESIIMKRDNGSSLNCSGITYGLIIPHLQQLFNTDKKLSATFKPSQIKDINFLEKLISQKENSLLLILDHVMDPQNVGSILRTALAANVDAVIVSKNRACHLTETVRKVSKGASEIIPFVIVNNIKYLLKNLKTLNFNILGCDGTAEKNYYECDYNLPTAIIMLSLIHI